MLTLSSGQEDTLLPAIAATVSGVVCNILAAGLLPRVGQWTGNVAGLFLVAVGFVVYGFGSVGLGLGQAGPYLVSVHA